MKVRFWGTRGSIASPGPHTAKYGGNTSCVEVRADDGTLIVLDCGTGARALGEYLLATEPRPLRIHLFIGHTHWDHIQGFPFFVPVFLPDTELNIYAAAEFQRSLEEAMAGQMQYSYFPIKLYDLHSRIHFTELEEGFFRVGDVLVETQHLNHTAPTMAYRISSGGATVAYVTDHEPFWPSTAAGFQHPGDQRHIAFLRGANLVIHDAQYTAEEYPSKIGWGHSTIEYATEVALAAEVGSLALFHHDPSHDDASVERLEQQAASQVAAHGGSLEVFAAREGLEIEVHGGGQAPTVTAGSALRRRPVAGGRVLVVSPLEHDFVTIRQALAEDGLVLASAPDGRAALAQAREMTPDLVILQAQLPDGSGEALVHTLRTRVRRPNLPALLLTEAPAGAIPFSSGTAITDYLAVPFSPPMLRTRVRAWLARTFSASRRRSRERGTDGMPEGAAPVSGARRRPRPARDTYVTLLASVPLFRALSHEQLQALAGHATEEMFEAGHVIVRQGGPADRVYGVLSGRVRVTEAAHDSPHTEVFLSELGPGEVFGELGVLSDQTRAATVMAVERTRCLALPANEFRDMIRSAPDLASALLRVLAGRIYDANRMLARYAPDPLTGLINRRGFLDQYRRLAASARRRNGQLLLLLCDIVELKAINDRFGYDIGDEALRVVADALVQAIRGTDVVARYGGDEFVALLEDAGPSDVPAVLGRIEQKLQDIAVKRRLPLPVRCRIGVAARQNPPETADELLQQADQEMLRSPVELPQVSSGPSEPLQKDRQRRRTDV